MGRRLRVAVCAVLLGLAAVLALYGLFAISYNGDRESGATYVLVAGHRIDADIVGANRAPPCAGDTRGGDLAAAPTLGGSVRVLRLPEPMLSRPGPPPSGSGWSRTHFPRCRTRRNPL